VEKFPISLVIITLNEEQNIARCIQSAPWVDDVVVLDSKSQDKTREIAKSLGARVVVEEFKGYVAQKRIATELAKHDWILSLDADEALSPESQEEVLALLKNGELNSTNKGFEFPRLSYHMGRWIRHGGWYPDYQLRLFNRKRAKWEGGHVHERVKSSETARLSEPILHYVFRDLSSQVETNNEYSSRGAQDLFDKKKCFSIIKLIFKPISKFLETYLVKKGFLDGLAGFIISVGAAYSVFLKFAKLWEIERSQK
jgi:glycosyltransferase involved in cell wall biosynthesis